MNFNHLFNKIPPFFRNKYVFTITFFAFWMIFIDSNSLISHIRINKEINSLNKEIESLQSKNSQLKEDLHEVKTNPDEQERYLRENYNYSKPNETIYYIEKK